MKKRIMVILPIIPTKEGTMLLKASEKVCTEYVRPSTEVDIVNIDWGPASVESCYDDFLAGYYVLEKVKEAERKNYDAVVISCFADPALEACREIASIPVVSAGEASYLLAAGLYERFGVVTPIQGGVARNWRRARALGVSSKVVSVEVARIPVLEMGDRGKLKRALLEAAKKLLDKGANAVVLGCTGMTGLAQEISRELNVPVVDPFLAALKLAENLVDLGLSQSKLAYAYASSK